MLIDLRTQAASPLVRTGSGLADSGEAVSGMAPTSRPYYESKFALNELPTEMPTDGMAARHVQATIVDQHELDFPEKLNTSSYVTVVEEPEEENVALVGLKVNLADQTVYPSSFDLHDRCVSMIAKLWHAPDGP